MSFDFPNSPTNGQVFAPTGGPVYVYTGGVWRMQGSGQVVTAEARNRIVNGAMQISQEFGDATGTNNGRHLADQFLVNWNTTGTVSAGHVAAVTPNGSKYRIQCYVSVADTSIAATDLLQIFTQIEGIRIADFRWGTAQARQVVLRFGWKSPAGTYSVGLSNSAGNRSFIAMFTISAAQANTDTEQVIVIPGDTSGVWLTDTGIGISLRFQMALGTTFQGVAGWQAGLVFATSAITNGLATVGNSFDLFDVGLYLDPNATGVPPPWEMPDEAQELAACQRYFATCYVNAEYHGLVAGVTQWYATTQFPVPMRANPTMSGGSATNAVLNQAGNLATASTFALATLSPQSVRVWCAFSSTSMTGINAQAIYASARM